MQQNTWFFGKNAARLVVIAMLTFGLVACGEVTAPNAGNNSSGNLDTGIQDTGVGEDIEVDPDTEVEQDTEVEGTISASEKWEDNIIVKGHLMVESALTIEPCTTVYVAAGARIFVQEGGLIKSVGTEDCRVTIRSAKSSGAAGDWEFIEIKDSASQGNVFEYTDILHGGGGGKGVLNVADGASVSVKNARFESIKDDGVVFVDGASFSAFEDVHFEKVGKTPLKLSIELVRQLGGVTGAELGKPWVEVVGSKVTEGQTWKGMELAYFLDEGLEITDALKIEAGATVMLGDKANVIVKADGSLQTRGTADAKVVFQGAKSSAQAGDWGCIRLGSANDNVLEHTDVIHGGGTDACGTLFVGPDMKVNVRHVTFKSSAQLGAMVLPGAVVVAFSNVHFEDVEGMPLIFDIDQAGKLEAITGTGLEDARILLRGDVVETAQTWKALEIPYSIEGSTKGVAEIKNALEIEAGTTVLMEEGLRLLISSENGVLKTHGSEQSRVIIESSKQTKGAGDWDSIMLGASTLKGSELNFTTIRHGGGGSPKGVIRMESNTLIELNHVDFEQNEGCHLNSGGTINATNTAYTRC